MSDAGMIEWLTERVLEALARDEPLRPVALTLLLRRYRETDRPDLGETIGAALARALDERAAPSSRSGEPEAEWLMLFVEASALSDDERLRDACTQLVADLRARWSALEAIEPLTFSIGACLLATSVVNDRGLVSDAIDELERAIGAAYRPGDGLAQSVAQPRGARGRLGDHVRTSAALLTAYELTARLPYAMLADELMQFARRRLWDDRQGGFFGEAHGRDPDERAKPFALNCEAARVLCRLAALHASAEYRAAAVLAPETRYREDAACALEAVGDAARQLGAGGAIYGVALDEFHAMDLGPAEE